MVTKHCTKCNIEKSTTQFSKRKAKRDGLKSQCKACVKLYNQATAEHRAATRKLYNQANKEHRAARKKLYNQTPTGKAVKKAAKHNRRARKKNNGGTHAGAEILQLFDLQSGACPYCKAKLHKTGKNKYHVDHVIPLSKGGSNDIANIQLLCPPCNLSKSDKPPEEFAAQFNKLF